ncbi:MAG: DHHA1 domain-containing protein [Clostridiales bacterium]|nr:DHHA1 domain-containing protein [Clostridiales bacterium]
MMKTRKLFYENVYQTEFDAEVISCGQDDHGRYIELDQTAFYPEGGGQPADTGVLHMVGFGGTVSTDVDAMESRDGKKYRNPPDEIAIFDVQYAGEAIRHYFADRSEVVVSFSVGSQVHGIIDWNRRFDLMQQHSGEHIVSGFIHEQYGYDNVGFHMGEDVITIDLNGLLDKDQMAALEQKVNTYIWTNRKVHIFIPGEQERKDIVYRSKKELSGEVRLVEFPQSDLCACCGLHVTMTGEIGLVKLLSVKHFREGVRMEMVSGKRALDLMNEHFQSNSQVAVALSVKPGETKEAVCKLQVENYSPNGRIIQLQKEHFHMRARQCEQKENVLIVEEHLEAADIRKEADCILDACRGIGVVISGEDSSGYKYAVGQRNGNVRAFVKEMNQELSGRGGGKPEFAQGSLKAAYDDIREFFESRSFTILL